MASQKNINEKCIHVFSHFGLTCRINLTLTILQKKLLIVFGSVEGGGGEGGGRGEGGGGG